ncbi:hypothetical protein QBC37DRAFT_98469 [Rhypophila decipiens]|uniref:Uncharacterized protein n=1 Tax=Rhypophila decipiens TaxID=261697 RepID=A0AAN6YDX9_9PEZI|nr:hypothetical protein QBC37DRAFT_98469 [Rhypophila decipiens]
MMPISSQTSNLLFPSRLGHFHSALPNPGRSRPIPNRPESKWGDVRLWLDRNLFFLFPRRDTTYTEPSGLALSLQGPVYRTLQRQDIRKFDGGNGSPPTDGYLVCHGLITCRMKISSYCMSLGYLKALRLFGGFLQAWPSGHSISQASSPLLSYRIFRKQSMRVGCAVLSRTGCVRVSCVRVPLRLEEQPFSTTAHSIDAGEKH